MKKLSLVAALLMGLSAFSVQAANDCAYSPLQNAIRNARDSEQIEDYIQRGGKFDERTRCGGTLMQLAILRGNPNVLVALLNQDNNRANEVASIEEFRIPNAPRQIPLVLFAAYYAPNADMIYKLNEAGADFTVEDESGRNILWYMDQNPVLRNTYLYDQLNELLLNKLVQSQTAPTASLDGEAPKNAEPQKEVKFQTQGEPVSASSAMAIAKKVQPKKNKILETTTN